MEKVFIDKDRCTLCGLCIPICVRRILEEGDDSVSVTNPSQCILCGHCKAVCPEDAPQLPSLNPNEFDPAPVRTSLPQPDALMKLFRSRRSTRIFREDPVEKEKLERIIQAGRFAPTGANLQPVHFTVISTKKHIDQIRLTAMDVLVDQAEKIEAAVKRHKENGDPLSSTYQFRKAHIQRFREMPRLLKQGVDRLFFGAAAVITCHVNPGISSATQVDACLSAMQMVLMAEALGLGTCFIGAFIFAIDESPDLKYNLEIPVIHKATISFVLGYQDVVFSSLVAREPARVTWI